MPEKPGKAPPLSTQLLPLMLVSLASGLVLAQAFLWGQEISLADVSDIFNFFFGSGAGKEGSVEQAAGDSFFTEKTGEGGLSEEEGGKTGAARISARRMGGGG